MLAAQRAARLVLVLGVVCIALAQDAGVSVLLDTDVAFPSASVVDVSDRVLPTSLPLNVLMSIKIEGPDQGGVVVSNGDCLEVGVGANGTVDVVAGMMRCTTDQPAIGLTNGLWHILIVQVSHSGCVVLLDNQVLTTANITGAGASPAAGLCGNFPTLLGRDESGSRKFAGKLSFVRVMPGPADLDRPVQTADPCDILLSLSTGEVANAATSVSPVFRFATESAGRVRLSEEFVLRPEAVANLTAGGTAAATFQVSHGFVPATVLVRHDDDDGWFFTSMAMSLSTSPSGAAPAQQLLRAHAFPSHRWVDGTFDDTDAWRYGPKASAWEFATTESEVFATSTAQEDWATGISYSDPSYLHLNSRRVCHSSCLTSAVDIGAYTRCDPHCHFLATRVALAFPVPSIPHGAVITSVSVLFEAAQPPGPLPSTHTSSPTVSSGSHPRVLISADSAPAAMPLSSSIPHNVSGRVRTNQVVSWQMQPWSFRSERREPQRTPDLRSILLELLSQPNRQLDDGIGSLVLMFEPDPTHETEHTAVASTHLTGFAPKLHVKWSSTDTMSTAASTGSTVSTEPLSTGRPRLQGNVFSLVRHPYDGQHRAGVRFDAVQVPPRARVHHAYAQWVSAGSDNGTVSVRIRMEVSAGHTSSRPLGLALRDLEQRDGTAGSVTWAVHAWKDGDSGIEQQTPDLSKLVQTLVDRPGWRQGDPITLLLEPHLLESGGDRSALAGHVTLFVRYVPLGASAGVGSGAGHDACDDMPGFVDERGRVCRRWSGYDCGDARRLDGYSEAGVAHLKQGCPMSCGLCRPRPAGPGAPRPCYDDVTFRDEHGYRCGDWHMWPPTCLSDRFPDGTYTPDQIWSVQSHCPHTCDTCHSGTTWLEHMNLTDPLLYSSSRSPSPSPSPSTSGKDFFSPVDSPVSFQDSTTTGLDVSSTFHSFQDPITISTCLRQTGHASGFIVENRPSSNSADRCLGVAYDVVFDRVFLYHGAEPGVLHHSIVSDPGVRLSDSLYHQLTITVSPSAHSASHMVHFYVDGLQHGTPKALPYGTTSISTCEGWAVVGDGTTMAERRIFVGQIEEMTILSRAMPAAHVAAAPICQPEMRSTALLEATTVHFSPPPPGQWAVGGPARVQANVNLGTSRFTLTACVKLAKQTTGYVLANSKRETTDERCVGWSVDGVADRMSLHYGQHEDGSYQGVHSARASHDLIDDGKWHHVAVVVGSLVTFHVDGVRLGHPHSFRPGSGRPRFCEEGVTLVGGRTPMPGQYAWDGAMRKVMVWNRALVMEDLSMMNNCSELTDNVGASFVSTTATPSLTASITVAPSPSPTATPDFETFPLLQGAVDLSGSPSLVEVNSMPFVQDELTVTACVKIGPATQGYIMANSDSSDHDHRCLAIFIDAVLGRIILFFGQHPPSVPTPSLPRGPAVLVTSDVVPGLSNVTLSRWHHVTAVLTQSHAVFYFDGEPVGQPTDMPLGVVSPRTCASTVYIKAEGTDAGALDSQGAPKSRTKWVGGSFTAVGGRGPLPGHYFLEGSVALLDIHDAALGSATVASLSGVDGARCNPSATPSASPSMETPTPSSSYSITPSVTASSSLSMSVSAASTPSNSQTPSESTTPSFTPTQLLPACLTPDSLMPTQLVTITAAAPYTSYTISTNEQYITAVVAAVDLLTCGNATFISARDLHLPIYKTVHNGPLESRNSDAHEHHHAPAATKLIPDQPPQLVLELLVDEIQPERLGVLGNLQLAVDVINRMLQSLDESLLLAIHHISVDYYDMQDGDTDVDWDTRPRLPTPTPVTQYAAPTGGMGGGASNPPNSAAGPNVVTQTQLTPLSVIPDRAVLEQTHSTHLLEAPTPLSGMQRPSAAMPATTGVVGLSMCLKMRPGSIGYLVANAAQHGQDRRCMHLGLLGAWASDWVTPGRALTIDWGEHQGGARRHVRSSVIPDGLLDDGEYHAVTMVVGPHDGQQGDSIAAIFTIDGARLGDPVAVDAGDGLSWANRVIQPCPLGVTTIGGRTGEGGLEHVLDGAASQVMVHWSLERSQDDSLPSLESMLPPTPSCPTSPWAADTEPTAPAELVLWSHEGSVVARVPAFVGAATRRYVDGHVKFALHQDMCGGTISLDWADMIVVILSSALPGCSVPDQVASAREAAARAVVVVEAEESPASLAWDRAANGSNTSPVFSVAHSAGALLALHQGQYASFYVADVQAPSLSLSIDPSCQDDPDFVDEKGYRCDGWVGFDCYIATEYYEYSPSGMADLLQACPSTCTSCAGIVQAEWTESVINCITAYAHVDSGLLLYNSSEISPYDHNILIQPDQGASVVTVSVPEAICHDAAGRPNLASRLDILMPGI